MLFIGFHRLLREAYALGLMGNKKLHFVYMQTLKEKNHEIAINNLKWKMSHLTQRWILEKFYRKFWSVLVENEVMTDKEVRNIYIRIVLSK